MGRTVQPTNFSVTIRQAGRDFSSDVSGSLTSYETGALRETISRLLKAGRKNIVLNLAHCNTWTSSGIGELRRIYVLDGESEWPDESGRLVAKVEEILKITQLYQVFPGISERRAPAEFSGIRPQRNHLNYKLKKLA